MYLSVVSNTNRIMMGLIAGLVAGVVFYVLAEPPLGAGLNLVISAALGVIFGLIFGPKIYSFGASLVWGQAYGLLCWLVGPLTLVPWLSGQGLNWTAAALREAFPLLLGLIVAFGATLGLTYYLFVWGLSKVRSTKAGTASDSPNDHLPRGQAVVPPPVQAAIVGGLGGLLGSWIFALGIERAEFFPLVAAMMGSDSIVVGEALHYVIGTLIGLTFGLLFQRDIQGAGSALVWGMNYGLVWWVVGPMTLLPWFLGFQTRPDWSPAAGQVAFSALAAHLLYGALVGLFYALVNKLWNILFVDSDPLNRSLEGAGARGLRGGLMGLAGGIIGGLLFSIVMVGIGALPDVASLIGSQSALTGFIVHLIFSIFIGISYGLLFQREAYSYGSGLAWGMVYGLLWWLVGAQTLFFVLLRQPVDWSLPAVLPFYPALIGHLLYGAGLGLFFQFLARRYDDALSSRPQRGSQGTPQAYPTNRPSRFRTAGTPASALWAVMLTIGVMLPLLLSAGS